MDAYKISGRICEGIYSKVYKGYKEDNKYAVKIVNEIDYSLASCNELCILKKYKHPNIIESIEMFYDIHINRLCIVFEYYPLTLEGWLTSGDATEEKCVHFISQLCEGLHYLHSNNIIHGDIKHDNILIKENKLVIADFGLSRVFFGTENNTGVIHSRAFRAPEVKLGNSHTFKADIWALGILIKDIASYVCFSPLTESMVMNIIHECTLEDADTRCTTDFILKTMENEKLIEKCEVNFDMMFEEIERIVNFYNLKAYYRIFVNHLDKTFKNFTLYESCNVLFSTIRIFLQYVNYKNDQVKKYGCIACCAYNISLEIFTNVALNLESKCMFCGTHDNNYFMSTSYEMIINLDICLVGICSSATLTVDELKDKLLKIV